MLSFRLGIFTGVAAVCLWGLYSLLGSLNEPGLLRTEKATVVKGCDALESDEARQQCPGLFCQKALLDAKLVPRQAQFDVSADRQSQDDERVIAGVATSAARDGAAVYFACELAGLKVVDARQIDQEEFDELTNGEEAPAP